MRTVAWLSLDIGARFFSKLAACHCNNRNNNKIISSKKKSKGSAEFEHGDFSNEIQNNKNKKHACAI